MWRGFTGDFPLLRTFPENDAIPVSGTRIQKAQSSDWAFCFWADRNDQAAGMRSFCPG